MERVIGVFEVSEIKNRCFLINHDLKVRLFSEKSIPPIHDETDNWHLDIDSLVGWITSCVHSILRCGEYELVALNYTSEEASLAFLNKEGELLAPIYFNTWPMSKGLIDELYKKYGGQDEFCRRTGSPSSGMLNSGLQILWFKKYRKELFDQMAFVLHFPQFLSHIFTHSIVSECTSIGCHTSMWDFDNRKYHPWLVDEGIILTNPMCNDFVIKVDIEGHAVQSGIGVHDRSASLVPFMRESNDDFLLVSTGRRCVNMNPFNQEPLTPEQLNQECFYLYGDHKNPFQASRWEMGQIYEINMKMILSHYRKSPGDEKAIEVNEGLISSFLKFENQKIFCKNGILVDVVDKKIKWDNFTSFEEAYHRFMFDFTLLEIESLNKILSLNVDKNKIIVTGEFVENELFVHLMATLLPQSNVYIISEDYTGALGAALVLWHSLDERVKPHVINHLKHINPYPL